MVRKPASSRGLRDVAACSLTAALCLSATALGVADSAASPSMRLVAAASSLNPADGGPGGMGGDSGGGVAPAPSKSRPGGGSGSDSGASPAVSHLRSAKSDTPGSGPQLDRVLPRPLQSSSGNAGGGAPAAASAAAPEASGAGGWISKIFSMVGDLLGSGGPGDKPAKSSAASSSSSSGDAPQVTGDPGKKPSAMGASKGQTNKAPTPDSVIHSVQSGVDKLIGSVIHTKPAN